MCITVSTIVRHVLHLNSILALMAKLAERIPAITEQENDQENNRKNVEQFKHKTLWKILSKRICLKAK